MARFLLRVLPAVVLAGGLTLTLATAQAPSPSGTATPKMEAVAETRLLMEGLAQSNFRGITGLLKTPPPDAETWSFIRGQALLIAETGNLLLVRPPKNAGQKVWMEHATELRDRATQVARQAGARDYTRVQAALQNLARTCNRCHQSFRIPTRISDQAPSTRDTE
jgi:hypothetical protein